MATSCGLYLWAGADTTATTFRGSPMHSLAAGSLTGIWRYHTGLPINFQEATGFDAVASQQASDAVRIRPVATATGNVRG